MPVMDRFEVAKTIKNDLSLRNIKIVMLSSVGKLNHKQIQEYNIDDSVAKPVKQSNLFDTIMQVLRIPVKKVVTAAPVVSLEIQPDRKHLRILVAEDNVDNQNLAKTFLQKAGYTAGIAENGKLAVDAVRNLPYDLILMDVQMPEMDGFEATGEMRRWEKEQCLERISIIALTAHAVEGYREKCLESGMDDYITKPIKKMYYWKLSVNG